MFFDDVIISASLRLGGVPRSSDDHVILVGDAAGMIDPMTGGYSNYPHSPVCLAAAVDLFPFPLCLCYSFIHFGYFYSASLSTLLLRGIPDTGRILCQSFTPKRHRRMKYSPSLSHLPTNSV